MTEQTVERAEAELLPILSRSRPVPGWDLLRWRWLKRWVHHPVFPTIFRLSGDVAGSLVEIYRTLGGGWQILYPGNEQLQSVTATTIEGAQPAASRN